MHRIHHAIQSGSFPNAHSLAQLLEVSRKSIYRDLEFMRERLALPLGFHWKYRGYYYTEKVRAFPSLQITEGELFAMLVAEKALQQYRGTPFERPLMSAFRKMSSALPETISMTLEDWEHSISFRTSAEPILNLDIFDALAKATARRRQIELTYRKPGQQEAEPRVVDPYHLANINGEWFLFAHCHLRKDIRTFVPARMLAVRETGKSFVRPKGFSLKGRLRDSFGVHSGQGEYLIRIRFDPLAAAFIREKKWHPSQNLREQADGGLELELRLSSLVEIQRWVLGWGGHAQVLQPPQLEAAVREAARHILELPRPQEA